MKKSILNFLGQLIPVMIGVYLGFALNNFGEERKTRKKFEVFQEILKTEIVDNVQLIDSVRPYHLEMRKEIKKIIESEVVVDEYENFKNNVFRGVRPAIVNNSAYETGIQTGMIQEFDLEVIQAINKAYAMQNVYTGFTENMVQSFSSKKLPENEAEILSFSRTLEMNFNDVQSIESILLSYYNELDSLIQ